MNDSISEHDAEVITRRASLQALRDELGRIYCDETDDAKRFVLVERSKYDGSIYVTSHDSFDDAASYHDHQEEPDDWPISMLVDLLTGERFRGWTVTAYSTTFLPEESAPC